MKRSLKQSLATAALLLVVIVVAGCSGKAPVLLPEKPPKARVVETGAVRDAAGRVSAGAEKVREATEKAAHSNERATDSAKRLTEAMARIRAMGEAEQNLEQAWLDAEMFAEELKADLQATKNDLAVALLEGSRMRVENRSLALSIEELTIEAAKSAIEIDNMDSHNDDIREIAIVNMKASADLIITKDKLEFWRWRFAPISIGVVTVLVLFIVYRPRIPFIT